MDFFRVVMDNGNSTIGDIGGQRKGVRGRVLTVEEFAAKEGVSVDMVLGCVQMVFLQSRRQNGRIFILDKQLTPYSGLSEYGRGVLAGEETHMYSETIEHMLSDEVYGLGDDSRVHKKMRGEIAELVQKMVNKRAENKGEL